MKRYKIKVKNSYYHYKQRKLWIKRTCILGLVFGAISIVIGVTYKNNEETIALPKIVPSNTHQEKDQPLYFDGTNIKYDVYQVPKEVKGIYIPPSKVDNYEDYIALTKTTEVNAFVIDLKGDKGYLTFSSHNPLLVSMGSVPDNPPIEHIHEVMTRLYEEDIYPIARIVVFKDSIATHQFPDRAVQNKEGQIYQNKVGDMWLNPYDKRNWEYILEVCKEAARLGFKEVQFDYVRFHESMDESTVQLDPQISKTQIITEFIKYIKNELKEYNIYVSADVFGTIINSKIDSEIVGQDFKELCKYLDYICPMVYPSHYGKGSFGVEYPHLAPYDIILRSMEIAQDEINKNDREDRQAIIRPWLQNFTMSGQKPYQPYGEKQIQDQIQGTYDAGLSEWLFWNAAGNYTEAGLDNK